MTKKPIFVTVILIQFFLLTNAQYQTLNNAKGFYQNPIFAGDYPDPSILRDGDTYYIVHSSFEYYPGLLVWKSKDMINWVPVSNALYKNIGSVWAPDLAKYKGKYYIYFPANNNIYVLYASSMSGPWSEPINLNVNGIDPGHFVDEKGKPYLYFANGSYVALADDGLSTQGEMKHAYAGWKIPREWSIECFCLEGPKITKHAGYYYLTVAEGGTAGPATSHMIISARSKSPLGPWENSPYNPIDKTHSEAEKWCSKGHGTLIDDTNGKWWMVYHAYEKNFYNMGRQTLLQPVEWTKDGWFKMAGGVKTENPIQKPNQLSDKSNFSLNDDFSGKTLDPQWKFFDDYDSARFRISDNSIIIKSKGTTIGESSPLVCVPSHHSYTAEVEMEMIGNAKGALTLFYNKDYSFGVLADSSNLLSNVHGWQFVTERNVLKRHVFLKIKNVNNTVDMYFSNNGIQWTKTETSFEVSGVHHNVLGGFLSLRIGLCSIGEGSVKFKNFKYQAIK